MENQVLKPLWQPQRKAYEAIIDANGRGAHLCVQAPTGGGKTRVAAEVAAWALSQGKRMMFYANRTLLVRQTAEKFVEVGVQVGVRAATCPDLLNDQCEIQVASAQTEWSRVFREQSWQPFDANIVVIDEAHLQRGRTMAYIVDFYKQRGAQIVMLTATPLGLGNLVDECFVSGSMGEYRFCKAIVPAKVYCISQPDMRKVKRSVDGEFVIDGKKRKVYTTTIVGEVISEWRELNPDGKPTILFAPGKAESVWLTEQFRKHGIAWAHVDATDAMVDGQRATLTPALWREIGERLRDGSIHGLSSRFKCVDAQTRILCKRGWATINDLGPDDLVASFNERDESISWDAPLRIIRQPATASEGMARLHSLNMDLRVTGTHSMLYKFSERAKDWRRANSAELIVKKGAYVIPVCGDYDAPGVPLTDSQLSFLGWFVTDGHQRKDTGAVVICQSCVQPQYIHDHIAATLTGCGVKWTAHQYTQPQGYGELRHYCVSRSELERVGLLKYVDKEIHDDLLEMTRPQLLVFLRAINLGDGCKRKQAGWRQRTLEVFKGNKRFVERLQALCVTRGMRCIICADGERAYRLYISPYRRVATIRGASPGSDEHGFTRQRLMPDEVRAGEEVWCVATKHGTIITERNGKVAIMGNCREGIDFPFIQHVVLATPIGSLASYIQCLGRGLRYSPETPDYVIVQDHGGNYHRHGSPNHDRPWEEWWNQRPGVASAGFINGIRNRATPEPIRCPRCKMERMYGSKCPGCGFQHEKSSRMIQMENGELREYVGTLVRKKYVRLKENTSDLWERMFWGWRKSKKPTMRRRTFAQMEAWFFRLHHYYPPHTLPLMPVAEHDWHRHVNDLPMDRIRPKGGADGQR